MHRFHVSRFVVAALISAIVFNPVLAAHDPDVPLLGTQVTGVTLDTNQGLTGELVDIKPHQRNKLNPRFCYIKVKKITVSGGSAAEVEIEGWYEIEKEEPQPVRSCCQQQVAAPVIVVQNNNAAVHPLRHYVGPTNFSVYNDNRDQSTHTTTNNLTIPQNAPRYCECGTAIQRYHFGPGGVADGHYCNTTNRLVRWNSSSYRYHYRY